MNMVLIFVYLILIIWLFFTYRKNVNLEVPKTIWLLWFQGWSEAPYLVNSVKKSWEKHNPGWNIKTLSNENIHKYIDVPYLDNIKSPAARSDVIRLSLLEKYGGVWADATMICMKPLNDWLPEMIEPSSVWMYHGREDCNLLASWFIIAKE